MTTKENKARATQGRSSSPIDHTRNNLHQSSKRYQSNLKSKIDVIEEEQELFPKVQNFSLKSDERSINNHLQQNVWSIFSQYVAQVLKTGRGLLVPKFGLFTFINQTSEAPQQNSSQNIDMDIQTATVQFRVPVFLIGKDFQSHLGIGINQAMFNKNGLIYQFSDQKCLSKNKPQLIDYSLNRGFLKDKVVQALSQELKLIGETLMREGQITKPMPYLGKLVVQNNLGAIQFEDQIHFSLKYNVPQNYTSTYFNAPVTVSGQGQVFGSINNNSKNLRSPSPLIDNKLSMTQQFKPGMVLENILESPGADIMVVDNYDLHQSQKKRMTKLPSSVLQNRRTLSPLDAPSNHVSSPAFSRHLSRQNLDLHNQQQLQKQDNSQPYTPVLESVRGSIQRENTGSYGAINSPNQLLYQLLKHQTLINKEFQQSTSVDIKILERLLITQYQLDFSKLKSYILEYTDERFQVNLPELFQALSKKFNSKKYSSLQKSQQELFQNTQADQLSLKSRPFSGIQSLTNSQSLQYGIKQGGAGSILSGQTVINGISKLTIKALSKEIVHRKKDLVQALALDQSTLDTSLTDFEVLMYLRRVGINIGEDYMVGLFRAINMNQEQREFRDSKITFKDLIARAQSLLDQLQIERETDHQILGQQLVRRLKDMIYISGRSADSLFKNHKNQNGKLEQKGVEALVNEAYQAVSAKQSIQQFTKRELEILFIYLFTRGFFQEHDKKVIFKKEIAYINFISMVNVSEPIKDWEAVGLKKLRDWIIKKQLNSKLGFEQILKYNNDVFAKAFNLDQFRQAMQKEGLPFTLAQIDFLFKALDRNNDELVDEEEWKVKIFDDFNNPLQMLREIVIQNEISGDEILHKMKLRLDNEPLDFPKFSKGLKIIDPTLNQLQLRAMFNELRSNQTNKVEIINLVTNLTGDISETVNIKKKIYLLLFKLISDPNAEAQLKLLFEDFDQFNDGTLDPHNLQRALRKMNIKTPDIELERFIRFLDKDSRNRIDFQWFLNQIKIQGSKKVDIQVQFRIMLDKLKKFMKLNKYKNAYDVVKKVGQSSNKETLCSQTGEMKVWNELFAFFIKSKVCKNMNNEQIKELVGKIDIDQDGKISESDLNTALGNANHDNFLQTATQQDFQLFPQQKMSEEKAIEVGRQIRLALTNQRISMRDAFQRLDKNHTGLLSFSDFSTGIDEVIQLSQPVKEKLFARMDVLSIGLVSYENFLEVIRQTTATQVKERVIDSFEWEMEVIKKIRDFAIGSHLKQSMSADQLFKNMDFDFDGFISIDDLKTFLAQVLEIRDIVETKLERLFKLLDYSKSGKIQLADIRKIIENNNDWNSTGVNANQIGGSDSFIGNTQNSGSFKQSMMKTKSLEFDWKSNAVQQIGIAISKNYQDIADCFESVSERHNKITFIQFKKFLEGKHILQGFNLTNQLYQELFAFIDPHKKGYITLSDFQITFQQHNWNKQCFQELKNQLQNSFPDLKTAFEFFICFKKINQQIQGSKPNFFREILQANKGQVTSKQQTYKSDRINMLNMTQNPANGVQRSTSLTSKQQPQFLNEDDFIRGVRTLMSTRYTDRELKDLWQQVLSHARNFNTGQGFQNNASIHEKRSIDLQDFKQIFGNLVFIGQGGTQLFNQSKFVDTSTKSYFYKNATGIRQYNLHQSSNDINGNPILMGGGHIEQNLMSASPSVDHYIQNLKSKTQMSGTANPQIGRGQATLVDVFEMFKSALKSSKFQLMDILSGQIENGQITSIQFRNAIKRIGVSMSSKDIDKLVLRLDPSSQGFINIANLQSKIEIDQNEERLMKRSAIKLNQLLKLIYKYMNSPQDAFIMFDQNNCGRLNLEEFTKMMLQLHELSGMDSPSFTIIRDIFAQIDANKDGIIDRNEWLNAFQDFIAKYSQAKTPTTAISTQGDSQSQTAPSLPHNPINSQLQNVNSIKKWKEVQNFEDLIASVAKNRKLITFFVMNKEKQSIVTSSKRQLEYHLQSTLVQKKYVSQALQQMCKNGIGLSSKSGSQINYVLGQYNHLIEQLIQPFILKEGTQAGGNFELVDFGRFIEMVKNRSNDKTGFPINHHQTAFEEQLGYQPVQRTSFLSQ